MSGEQYINRNKLEDMAGCHTYVLYLRSGTSGIRYKLCSSTVESRQRVRNSEWNWGTPDVIAVRVWFHAWVLLGVGKGLIFSLDNLRVRY
jgi:hypothetical protein